MTAFATFARTTASLAPRTAVVLGSGLAGATTAFAERASVGFADIPGLVPPSVQGHGGRLDPWPVGFERAFHNYGQVGYETMWGPSEFTVSGNLADFDRSSRLTEIRVPVLFTCGRHDEATPETVASYSGRLPGSKLVVFEQSSHMCHLEERDRYNGVIRDFLREVEGVTA